MSLEEFQLEFIPLDEDVLTLELPNFLRDYFLVSDCPTIALSATNLFFFFFLEKSRFLKDIFQDY